MDKDYRKAANITIIVMGIAAFLYLFFKHALGAALPFILAAIVATVISSPAKKLSKATRLPLKLVSALLVLLLFTAISALIYLAVSRLAYETASLVERLSSDPEIIDRLISQLVDKINGDSAGLGMLQSIFDIDVLESLGIDLGKMTSQAVSYIATSIAESVSSFVMRAVTSLPSLLLGMIIFLLSAFYLATDARGAYESVASVLPETWKARIPSVKSKLQKTLTGYIKAYLLIMLITFFEAFVGLSLLGVKYAFIIAAAIALVDVLPVLGTGTVLIPWAVFSFITSNVSLGIGLLVLYGVTLVVRQTIEPRVIGSTLGLHPLISLASVYLGLELLGFAGIFAGPVVAMLLFGTKPQKESTKKTTEVIKKE
jgi:sporulation integral membrane protein YtvI